MSPHRELRLAPPLAPAKFRLSQVPGDTIPQGWSGPAAVSEVTDDPGSGRVTPPPSTPAAAVRPDNLVGGGAKVGRGIDFRHSLDSRPFFWGCSRHCPFLISCHDPDSLAKIRLWEKVSQKLAFPGLNGIKSFHAFG